MEQIIMPPLFWGAIAVAVVVGVFATARVWHSQCPKCASRETIVTYYPVGSILYGSTALTTREERCSCGHLKRQDSRVLKGTSRMLAVSAS